jgi:magnesium-transporting ATPase (P-type)
MFLVSATMAAGTLYLFSFYHPIDYWRGVTISLTTMAVFQWYNGFNCQFLSESIFSRQIFRNPYLWVALLGNAGLQVLAVHSSVMQKVLKTTPLSLPEWGTILVICLSIILVEEVRKLVFRIYHIRLEAKEKLEGRL